MFITVLLFTAAMVLGLSQQKEKSSNAKIMNKNDETKKCMIDTKYWLYSSKYRKNSRRQ